MIRVLDKPPGWTPLQAMEAHRAVTPALAGEPMVYAGRLDPMACGLLLVLTGADRFALPAHLTHDKDYDATFLFGVASDTFDALGRLRPSDRSPPEPATCAAAVVGLLGVHDLPLPAWSAYRVRGRPLHAWAREGVAVPRPSRAMEVRAVGAPVAEEVSAASLVDELTARIGRVQGSFRQGEALADWRVLTAAAPPLARVRARLTVRSGTYVRALADAMGAGLGCGALLLALRRTRIGPYDEASIGLGEARAAPP